MKDKKLISIIIAVYNEEKNIAQCIDSINGDLAEIIIVNDGSTDNTLKICREYESKFNNVKVITQENKGQNAARFEGIKNATGEYIMFLDSDDCYFENTISRVEAVIKEYNFPDLIRFRYQKLPDNSMQQKYFEDSEKYIKKENFKEEVFPIFLDGYLLNALWTNCVKRSIICNFTNEGIDVKFGEDLLLNLKIFSNIENVVFINDVLYKYIYNPKSVTNSRDKEKLVRNLEDAINVYCKLYNYLLEWNMYEDKYINIVSNRIKKETNTILNRLGLKE